MNDRALMGLRGVAALMIAIHHYALLRVAPGTVPHFVMGSYLTVDLFFVLSGYVMALGYGHWFAPGRRAAPGAGSLVTYAEFMLRRLARLWPLHAVVTLLLLVQQYAAGTWTAWPKMIACNLLLVQSWGISQSLNPPS